MANSILTICKLLWGIPAGDMITLMGNISMRTNRYEKGEIVAFEGDECASLGMMIEGSVTIERLLPSGKRVVMDRLQAGDSFGEVVIFSDVHTYPASVVVDEPATIVFIGKESVLRMCSLSPQFLNNFMNLLSNKIFILNRKVKSLSFTSVRQKTANFILQKYTEQRRLTLSIEESRLEMADRMGVPRPSLSREMASLKAEGWIDFDRDTITIFSLEKLEDCLMEK